MKSQVKKDCVYGKQCYRHGVTVDQSGKSMYCDNGTWQESSE